MIVHKENHKESRKLLYDEINKFSNFVGCKAFFKN